MRYCHTLNCFGIIEVDVFYREVVGSECECETEYAKFCKHLEKVEISRPIADQRYPDEKASLSRYLIYTCTSVFYRTTLAISAFCTDISLKDEDLIVKS